MSKKFKKVSYYHGGQAILLRHPNTEMPFESVEFDKESLKKVIKKERKELQDHFKKHGWNLDRDHIRADILEKLLGFDILELIDHSLVADSQVAIDSIKGEYVLKAGYSPIYLDTYTGEIILVDKPQDKSYVMKYREINGFELIGFL
jgi:hypothetical protein